MNAPLTVHRRLSHVCLPSGDMEQSASAVRGTPLGHARLNDQQRIAVVFQGAALLAHLEHAGFYLGTGRADTAWDDARILDGGTLQVGEVRPGRAVNLPQTFLKNLLGAAFQTEREVAGRGNARRLARRQSERWHHRLIPTSTDLMVADLLDAAQFLWTPAFAYARRALAAEHWIEGKMHLWMVGPGRARRRFLQGARESASSESALSRLHLERLVASPEARELWEGFDHDDGEDPWQLYEAGRWQHAAAIWRRKKRRNPAETLALARCCRATGRASQAAELLHRRRDSEGVLLRAQCLMDLGERPTVEKVTHKLNPDDLEPMQQVELAEIRIRLAAAKYQQKELRSWIARLLALTSEPARTAGLITAAGAAFDTGNYSSMDTYLADASDQILEQYPELKVKWHQNAGLRRWQMGDGGGAVEHLTTAIGADRRRMTRLTAARLWNDLAVARELAEDLPGAEHACRHSLRLLAGCDGQTKRTLSLCNLAELRTRQGMVRGVADTLEKSMMLNRLAGNKRALAYDLQIWIRYELSLGRPTAALNRYAEAQIHSEVGNHDSLDVLAARAHGWLGQVEQAQECLDRREPEAVRALEPEERPAIWALAGRMEEASHEAQDTVWFDLWSSLAADLHPPASTWPLLDSLNPFRAARLVFDLEILRPGVVPPRRLQQALDTFRKLDLAGFAEMLERRSQSSWKALALYFERDFSLRSIAELLEDAGYEDYELTLIQGDVERVLVSTESPVTWEPTLQARSDLGLLILKTPHEDSDGDVDPILGALFAAIQADLQGRGGGLPQVEEEVNEDEDPSNRMSYHFGAGIVGRSPELAEAISKVDRLARGHFPILILGESGTGKESIARRVHDQSDRRSNPFLAFNCATATPSLMQSTLFGHVKGAFTGAERDHHGLFKSAHRGTLFLDEIGDLPKEVQGHLLRVLQEGEICPVGQSFTQKVDVRIVTATHHDLAAMVDEGTFRQDLYFRLRVAQIDLPPLRARGSDLLILAEHFANLERSRLDPEAVKLLMSYRWPGNIRELKHRIIVAATLADRSLILPEHLIDAGPPLDEAEPQKAPGVDVEPDWPIEFHQAVADYRKNLVSRALNRHQMNQSAAARDLKMTRQSLSYLARKMGLL